ELAGEQDDFHYKLLQFKVIKQIGSGAFGKVQLCRHIQTEEKVVLKIINKSWVLQQQQLDHVKEENTTMMELSAHECPFTVKTLGSFQDEHKLYFVMEFISGGELFAHLRGSKNGRFSEKKARFYAAELMLALKYMHEHEHIVYRDIKPENMLLDTEGHLKLIDFGFAKHLGESEKTYTFCGTPDYLAPEVIRGEGYNKEADFWSLGVFIYELQCGYAPFVTSDANGGVRYKDILNGQFSFPKWMTSTGKDLVSNLLAVDRKHRLGSKRGMIDVMEHPWFKDIDWNALERKAVKAPKPGKYKKGMVNLQPDLGRPSVYPATSDIDQSLFSEFDAVVKNTEMGLVATKLPASPSGVSLSQTVAAHGEAAKQDKSDATNMYSSDDDEDHEAHSSEAGAPKFKL
ncbi:AGC/PKA protein kinase, partial [Sphaeroforma arctica JP610]